MANHAPVLEKQRAHQIRHRQNRPQRPGKKQRHAIAVQKLTQSVSNVKLSIDAVSIKVEDSQENQPQTLEPTSKGSEIVPSKVHKRRNRPNKKRRALRKLALAASNVQLPRRKSYTMKNAPDPQDEETPPAFDLTDKDRENLARTDEQFEPHTWENLKEIIGNSPVLSTLR